MAGSRASGLVVFVYMASIVAVGAVEVPAPAQGPDHPPEGISAAGWRSILRQIEAEQFEARSLPGSGSGTTWMLDVEDMVVGGDNNDDAGSDSGSSYVFTINDCEWNESAKAVAADAGAFDEFGASVAISGDTAVVGAWADNAAGSFSGSAYVLARNVGGPDNWGQVKKLTAADAAAGDEFGGKVSISGDTAVVGARLDNDAGADSGSAYVFARNTGGADNWGQVKKLTASDAAQHDHFGVSVSISGDTVVVGANQNGDGGPGSGSAYVFARNAGGPDNWGEVKKLTASDAAAGDTFGVSVSISGDTVVVAAYQNDDAGSGSGSAYVFARNAGGPDNWGEVKKLTASDAAAGDAFGGSVSISGDTVVVGAFNDDNAGADTGSAYVFARNAGGPDNWGQVQKLTASNAEDSDWFGNTVSISGETVVVGAVFDDDAGFESGSAYVFARNAGGPDNWGQIEKLTASDAAPEDFFGASVSISLGTVVVGANLDDDAGSSSGSAYVFRFNCFTCGDGVTDTGEECDDAGESASCDLDCSFPDCGDGTPNGAAGEECDDAGESASCDLDCSFPDCGDGTPNGAAGEECDDAGESASCDANCTAASCGDGTYNPSAGEACDDGGESALCDPDCTFAECGDGWSNGLVGEACDDGDTVGGDGCAADCSVGCSSSDIDKLEAQDAAAGDFFGASVSISGDTVVVGAYEDDDAGSDSGSAYVLARNAGGPDNWGQVKKLTASDATAFAEFGDSVAISGDAAVVGAHSANHAGTTPGAAYVFARNTGGANNWGQVKKLTASDAALFDSFGASVSISGDTVVVGAVLDDDAGSNSGSAYVFARNVGWGQVKKLTASDAAAEDFFGTSVSINGDTVVVGASQNALAGGDAGAAYVFARNTGGADNWGQVKKLTASDPMELDFFGVSVSISGDTVVVGARQHDDAGSDSGAAYVFARNTGGADNWGQVKKLTAADAAAGDWFGNTVSISGDTVVVGARQNDDAGSDSGSAYVFARNAGGPDNWGQVKKLTASDAAAGDWFGTSVSITGDTVVVGAIFDDNAGLDSGSAYVFGLGCPGVPGEAGPAGDMRASRNGSSVDVTFEPACSATDHAAYHGRGPIVGSPQWFASTCGLGTSGTASFDPGVTLLPGEMLYFVVVGYHGGNEGSYGMDSTPAQRPEAVGIGICDRPTGAATCP